MQTDSCFLCNTDDHNPKFQNSYAIAIDDQYPVTLGHCLVFPKRHIASFFKMKKEEHKACLELLEKLRSLLINEDNEIKAFNLGINDGPLAGQTVCHCHIHLIPRRKDDVKDPTGGVRNIFPEHGRYD